MSNGGYPVKDFKVLDESIEVKEGWECFCPYCNKLVRGGWTIKPDEEDYHLFSLISDGSKIDKIHCSLEIRQSIEPQGTDKAAEG